jgi:hypothetical protein
VKSKRNRPLNPRLLWEINFGIGVTGSTDHLIVKGILGPPLRLGPSQIRTIRMEIHPILTKPESTGV